MANELALSATLRFSSGNYLVERQYSGLFTVTGTDMTTGTQLIGTSEEALAFSADIATPGYLFVKNMDATNYVEIRNATGAASTIKLKAGEFALFRISGTAPYAIANTAACRIEFVVIED